MYKAAVVAVILLPDETQEAKYAIIPKPFQVFIIDQNHGIGGRVNRIREDCPLRVYRRVTVTRPEELQSFDLGSPFPVDGKHWLTGCKPFKKWCMLGRDIG